MYPLATRLNVRLAELLGVLSLGTDIGLGQPMEHALRQCLIALRLADHFEVEPPVRSEVYYTALMMNVGSHSDAYERAEWFADDIAAQARRYSTDERRRLAAIVRTMRGMGAGSPLLRRLGIGARYVITGQRDRDRLLAEQVRIAGDVARRLRLPREVIEAIEAGNERWDGRGGPNHLSGLGIPTATRIVQLAEFAEVAHRLKGTKAAVELARRRSGTQFDPRLCAALCAEPERFLDGLDDKPAWQLVIDEQPTLAIFLSASQFDAALHMIADLVDVRSPYTYGHSRAVAKLASGAGERLGLDIDDVDQLYRAGLVHDVGRLGISNAIWHKRGVLTTDERSTLRTYPGVSERILSSAPVLRDLAELAGAHRERVDGSGYPLGLAGRRVRHDARVLAAADAYQSMREDRPHRIAYTAEEAVLRMRGEARAGRLDATAAEAVLSVAADSLPRGPRADQVLSPDEIAVLRLLVRGVRPRDISQELQMSQRRVERHVRQVFAKTNTSGRASASLYAMSRDLILE